MFMDIFDQILENLELERELGTRTVEIDRALLVPPTVEKAPEAEPAQKAAVPNSPAPVPQTETRKVQVPQTTQAPQSSPQAADSAPAAPKPSGPLCDIAFFTGRPLSPAGTEAMEKIFAAIRKIKADAVICLNEERKAKVYVLLGSDALKQRYPTAKAVRGGWVDGAPAMMTFSPDFIFSHFQEGSPRMRDAKMDMWNDIKSAVARI
jgi:hypothetical protein